MREIKFRAWDKTSKKMSAVYLINWFVGKCGIKVNNKKKCVANDTVVFMQYTGLNDKNGVEIYEGDIALYTDNFKVNGTTSHISSVEWNEELNGFYVKAVGFGYYSVNKQSIERYSVEVIGNIHENPKLLKGEE